MFDVAIIGAGPSGLACGIEAKAHGLSYVILDRGTLAEAIRRFPTNMTFFSTPELLELGRLPFSTPNLRPTRLEVLEYYRRVADYFDIKLSLYSQVTAVTGAEGNFELTIAGKPPIHARSLVIATGYFDTPTALGVPGETLPNVSYYYDEASRYVRSKVIVIGAGNSGTETALDLYRHGATVTLIHRGETFPDNVKYWIRPDIENRIKAGAIKVHFNAQVREITPNQVIFHKDGKLFEEDHDFVFIHAGYRPNVAFLQSLGITCDRETLVPSFERTCFASNVPGVYLAGSVICGCETGTVFIENGRQHAVPIMAAIAERTRDIASQ